MKTSELGGATLHDWIAKALGEEPGTAYTTSWPGFDQLLEREAIHVAPFPARPTSGALSWWADPAAACRKAAGRGRKGRTRASL